MTSESPPEAGEWIRLHNNTHMQVRLVIAGVIVAVVASLIPVRVAGAGPAQQAQFLFEQGRAAEAGNRLARSREVQLDYVI